jgi:hypothetical protein
VPYWGRSEPVSCWTAFRPGAHEEREACASLVIVSALRVPARPSFYGSD